MPVTNTQYKKMTDRATPPSKKLRNCIWAFLVGGSICAFGQFLLNIYQLAGLTEQQASSVVSMTLIALAAIATGLQIFDNIAKHAGAGTLVPITGFSNSVVAPAIEFKQEGHIMGIGAKMFTIAGPVLVFGIISSVIYGLVLWIFKLV